jgi:hypothetical protein
MMERSIGRTGNIKLVCVLILATGGALVIVVMTLAAL